jgi:hypothetical protein
MGRPTNINYDTVVLAVEKLIAEKKTCTLIDVHKILGGSLSTVSKHWKKWREEKGNDLLTKPRAQEPDAELNSIFKTELNRQISIIHETYEKKFREKEEEVEYLRVTLEKNEAQINVIIENEATLRENVSRMVTLKELAENNVKIIQDKYDRTIEELNKTLQENAKLNGALEEAEKLTNNKFSELISLIKTEISKKEKKEVSTKTSKESFKT